MSERILLATFNPGIKKYIFIYISLISFFSIVGIPFFFIWIFGLGKFVSKKYYTNLKCELTAHHLKFKKGVFSKVEKTIPLDNIQDLTFIENPFLNYFELKILKIETAGNSNSQLSDMKLMGILDCTAFKEAVLNQREQLKERDLSAKIHADSSTNSIELLTEIRDLLKTITNKE